MPDGHHGAGAPIAAGPVAAAATAPAARARMAEGAGDTSGTLLSLAPAAAELPRLLRIAIDAEQVGAARIHLAADQPDAGDAVAAIRAQTALVVTTDPGGAAEPFADRVGPGFTELVVPATVTGPDLLVELAALARERPGGTSVGGAGPAGLPVLLAALAVGLHVRVGTADTPSPSGPLGAGAAGPGGDIALIARAAGLARIAGRPPLPVSQARAVLELG